VLVELWALHVLEGTAAQMLLMSQARLATVLYLEYTSCYEIGKSCRCRCQCLCRERCKE
jgi:hypothetical protein